MKTLTLLIATISISLSTFAQEEGEKSKGRFGVAINSSIHGVHGEFSVAPTASYYRNKSQFEAGVCLYPFNFKSPRMLGGHLDYKFFPNGIDKRFSLYFNVNLNYTNQFYDQYYFSNNNQLTFNYLSLNGGYGFQVKIFENAYIGTNLNFGVSTNSISGTQNPVNQQVIVSYYPYEQSMFERFEIDGAFRINVGYRF